MKTATIEVNGQSYLITLTEGDVEGNVTLSRVSPGLTEKIAECDWNGQYLSSDSDADPWDGWWMDVEMAVVEMAD